LRHDLVMIGRLAVRPLPPAVRARLREPLAVVEAAMAAFDQASGAAILSRRPAPALAEVEAALTA
jgi:hypothetical protein